MLASNPANILNHNSPVGGIPSDSINLGNALKVMARPPRIRRRNGAWQFEAHSAPSTALGIWDGACWIRIRRPSPN
jgi:hypothetical protein